LNEKEKTKIQEEKKMKKTTTNPRIKMIALLTIIALLSTLFIFALCACDDKNDDKNDNESPDSGNAITNFIDAHLENILGFVLADDISLQYNFMKAGSSNPDSIEEAYGKGCSGLLFFSKDYDIFFQIFIYDTKDDAERASNECSNFSDSLIKSLKNNVIIFENVKGLYDSLQNYTINNNAITEKQLNFIKTAFKNTKIDEANNGGGGFQNDYFILKAFYADHSNIEYCYSTTNTIDEYSDEIALIGTKYSSDSYIKQEDGTIYIYLNEISTTEDAE